VYQFVFGQGSIWTPLGELYRAPPDPLAGLRKVVSEGKENKEEGWEGRGEDGSDCKFLDPPLDTSERTPL